LTTALRSTLVLFGITGCAALAACGAARYRVSEDLPAPLVSALPLNVAVRLPKAFSEYVQKDELGGSKIEIELGAAQVSAIRRVTGAMFQHTLMLSDESADDAERMAAQGISALIEVSVDSYVYLLPTSGSSDFYSASIGYKLELRTPDSKVLGSWIYEGYGSVPESGVGQKEGILRASALAIRDACANIAVHLPQQEIMQSLVTPSPPATTGIPAT
jgi:hypothetical protein